jgi:hypothetical protein
MNFNLISGVIAALSVFSFQANATIKSINVDSQTASAVVQNGNILNVYGGLVTTGTPTTSETCTGTTDSTYDSCATLPD